MDRAHRLGQTRQVTVYRLITRGTIDERIVQLARVKKDVSPINQALFSSPTIVQVQDIVVGNKNFTDVTKPSEIVQLLLNDEQLASLESSNTLPGSRNEESSEKQGNQNPVRDLWNEEGDDFFGHTTAPLQAERQEDENIAITSQGARGKRRKLGATVTHRKKPGPKKKTIPAVDPMNEF